MLRRYFTDEMVENILSNSVDTGLSGKHTHATILFFDLRGSTTIAEKLEPMLFSEFLSELFTDIMDLIYGNGGSVNKMLGDGILATFGVPEPLGDDTFKCAQTALQILDYLDTFNDVRPDYIEQPIRCGMGIASGNVFAGNIGSIRRMEYTVLGDAVNTAARLEALTKEARHEILIDANTYELLKERLIFERCSITSVRGKNEAMEIYKLLGTLQEDL
jgi:class 3 adenylate cyclase